MAKINEYPQASTINDNDLFVIDQTTGNDHDTKSASVSQIKQATRNGLTDNDISHYTGTPTPGTTAYEIANVTNTDLDDYTGLSTYVNSTYGKQIINNNRTTVINLDIEFKARSTSSGWVTLYTIPSGMLKPLSDIIMLVLSTNNERQRIRLTTNGELQLNLVYGAIANERICTQITYIS